ncbi:hypothetical protein RirG_209050 [Rhizophagus irregularis DAOM 197198w]|uniref:Uncharacterized protein n=1 Tax=Rhizophagus irregularis (strain DAOM 197198w) TaxID=1432141 RepID=A0A015JQE2_RHIIW|nr:hypothetical protein RirG_209050 [Rhizophagus irregularis DAOM 197198w]
MQTTYNSNVWAEEAISERHIRHYEYKDFRNIEKVILEKFIVQIGKIPNNILH